MTTKYKYGHASTISASHCFMKSFKKESFVSNFCPNNDDNFGRTNNRLFYSDLGPTKDNCNTKIKIKLCSKFKEKKNIL